MLVELVTIGLWDTDPVYAERFRSFIRNSRYRANLELRVYTDSDPLFLKQPEKELAGIDLLLVHRQWLTGERISMLAGQVSLIALEEHGEPATLPQAASGEGSLMSIGKYQPMHLLVDQLLHVALSGRKPGTGADSGCPVLAVMSAAGGTGKTAIACNLAMQLAEWNRRVCFLSLESVPFGNPFVMDRPEPDDAFERLVYYCRANRDHLAEKLAGLIGLHSTSGVYSVPIAGKLAELEDMTEEATKALICGLAESGRFDCLVIDPAIGLHPRTVASLGLSDRIFWIATDDANALHKSRILSQELADRLGLSFRQWKAKTVYLLNRCNGQPVNDPFAWGLNVQAILPEVPEWRTLEHPSAWLAPQLLREKLARLLWPDWQQANEPMPAGGEVE